jgi:hypothetical protein
MERPPMSMDYQNYFVKMVILPKAVNRFDAILITFFKEICKKISPKFHMEERRPGIVKAILNKKSNSGGITIPDIKLCYRATVTKTKMTRFWHKNRHIDQWNTIKDPEISPHSYNLLIFDKSAKKHILEKRQSLQQMVLEKLGIYL